MSRALICSFNHNCESSAVIFSVFVCYCVAMFNVLLAGFPFLSPLKISEKQRLSHIFGGIKRGATGSNGTVHLCFTRVELH